MQRCGRLLKESRRYLVGGMFALTGILGLESCDDPVGPLRDSRGVLLAVVGHFEEPGEIYAMRPDGSEMRRLTNNTLVDTDPDWSPDGQRIAFASARDSLPGAPERRPDVYVMNDDGSNVRQIPSAAGENFSPEWSPDGTRILFLSNRPPRGWWTMYIVNVDGTGEHQLSDDSACLYNIFGPRWTPDGSRIGYTCEPDGGMLFTVRADGGDKRLLIPFPPGVESADLGAVWAPDGSQVAFTSNRSTLDRLGPAVWHVFVATAAGGNVTQITRDSASYTVADWGPPR